MVHKLLTPKKIAKIVTLFLLTAVIMAVSSLCALYAFGFLYNLDVNNALVQNLTPQQGVTIDDNEVPNRSHASVSWSGNIENPVLSELSGYAVSQYRDDVFYGLNDSGGEAEIFAFSETGHNLGVLRLDIPKPRDWEDMASYRLDNISYLLIGDTGDNLRWHRESFLHIVEEPEIPTGEIVTVSVERTIRFQFPDGPRDCEGIAVDVLSDSIFLLSKRTIPAEIYRLPLAENGSSNKLVTAEKLALLNSIPQPGELDIQEDPDYGRFRSQPTAFDVVGNRSIVTTYNHAYLYTKEEGESWKSAFSKIPQRIKLPPANGREAAALSRDGKYLYTSGEREDGTQAAPIFKVNL